MASIAPTNVWVMTTHAFVKQLPAVDIREVTTFDHSRQPYDTRNEDVIERKYVRIR